MQERADEIQTTLENLLDNGSLFLSEEDPNFPKVLSSLLDHEACTKMHLMQLFVRYCDSHPEYAELILKHCKFPTTRDDAIPSGQSAFSNTQMTTKNARLLLEKVPHLLSAGELAAIEWNMDRSAQKLINPEWNSNKNSLEYEEDTFPILFNLFAHPDYQYLPPSKTVKTDKKIHRFNDYPFYWAAQYGFTSIFKLFYFHPDTPDEAKLIAVYIANNYKQTGLLQDLSTQLANVHLKTSDSLFKYYLTLKNIIPVEDVIPLIVQLIQQKEEADCLDALVTTMQPPKTYQNASILPYTLFKRETVTLDALIYLALTGVDNYFFETPKGNESSYASCLKDFLNSIRTNEMKILGLFSVMNSTGESHAEIRHHLKNILGKHQAALATAVEKIAEDNHLEVEQLQKNFLRLIDESEEHYLWQEDEAIFEMISQSESAPLCI